MTEKRTSPHSDRLADISLKWVQTYNATTDNEPRTAAMRSDIWWLVEQLETLRAGLEMIANTTYSATYVGTSADGTKFYGGPGDAPRHAREVLDRVSNPTSGERVAAGMPSSTSATAGASQSPEDSSPAKTPPWDSAEFERNAKEIREAGVSLYSASNQDTSLE